MSLQEISIIKREEKIATLLGGDEPDDGLLLTGPTSLLTSRKPIMPDFQIRIDQESDGQRRLGEDNVSVLGCAFGEGEKR